MAEVSIKQKVQDLLERPVDRTNYKELVKSIYASFRTVDQANDCLKERVRKLETASEEDVRDEHEQIGILAYALGEYALALEHLESVKTRKEASHFLGRVCMALGRNEEALSALEGGRRGSDDFTTDMLVVDVLCGLREEERARKLCEAYGKSHADDPDWLYAMGRVLETEGRYDEAMEHYEQAISRDPEHGWSLFRLAVNCDLNGEDDRAIELYERCAAIRPTFVGALMNLGVLYEDRSQYDKAMECYRQVLALDPTHSRARLFLKDAEASLSMLVDEEQRRRVRAQDEILQLPISNFELSARCRHVLEGLNVRTLGDLVRCSEEELLNFKNFGETSLQEIRDLLSRNNLQFGQAAPVKPPRLGPGVPAEQSEEMQEKLSMPVEFLGLSTRGRKCMERLNINTVGELIEHTEEDLLSTPNFGRTSIAEIKSKLSELGLALREE